MKSTLKLIAFAVIFTAATATHETRTDNLAFGNLWS